MEKFSEYPVSDSWYGFKFNFKIDIYDTVPAKIGVFDCSYGGEKPYCLIDCRSVTSCDKDEAAEAVFRILSKSPDVRSEKIEEVVGGIFGAIEDKGGYPKVILIDDTVIERMSYEQEDGPSQKYISISNNGEWDCVLASSSDDAANAITKMLGELENDKTIQEACGGSPTHVIIGNSILELNEETGEVFVKTSDLETLGTFHGWNYKDFRGIIEIARENDVDVVVDVLKTMEESRAETSQEKILDG